jgi:hypothetical protein
LFRDRARRSAVIVGIAIVESASISSARPGRSQSIDSPPLPRKRSSRGEGRCRLVGGSIRNLGLCRSPAPCRANFFWRECGPLGAALWGSSGGCESAGTAQGSAPTTRSVGVAFDQGGFQERKVPGT